MKRATIGHPKRKKPDWLAPLDDARDEEILGAAFDVFGEKGFHGATMLEIASRAHASKKTLYARFAGKAELFRALIVWGCRHNLPHAIPPDDGKPEGTLEKHAVTLLTAMMRPESLALFRIVAAEAARFSEIGKHFDTITRRASIAILDALAERLVLSGRYAISDPAQFGEDFIALLRGDIYFRVLVGAVPIPNDAAIAKQAKHAVRVLLGAYSR
jgi:TetR/AcrR family transcriptional repressor of mexJK operon